MGGANDDSNTYMVTINVEAIGVTDMMDVTVEVTNADEMGTVTLAPTQPSVGTQVTATLADADNVAAGTVNWVWATADTMDGNYTTVSTASAAMATYTPVEGDAGKYLKATVTYDDAHGEDKMASSEAVMVGSADVVSRYDTNGTSGIQIAELFDAIEDYFDGEIGITELFEVINAYFGR